MTRAVPDDIRDLRDHAERFRRLARVVQDERNRQQLLDMAKELDAGVDALEQADRTEKR
jgi:tetrahydromethanopterin S-methyltransferase subunit F